MMPSFGNLAIQNLKDTALVSLISLGDLTFRAEQLRNYTQDSTTIYTLLLFIYFGMALVLAFFMRLLERYTSRWRAGRERCYLGLHGIQAAPGPLHGLSCQSC